MWHGYWTSTLPLIDAHKSRLAELNDLHETCLYRPKNLKVLILILCLCFSAWIAIDSLCSRGTMKVCTQSGRLGLGLSQGPMFVWKYRCSLRFSFHEVFVTCLTTYPSQVGLQIKLKSFQKSLHSWMFRNWTINLFQRIYHRTSTKNGLTYNHYPSSRIRLEQMT